MSRQKKKIIKQHKNNRSFRPIRKALKSTLHRELFASVVKAGQIFFLIKHEQLFIGKFKIGEITACVEGRHDFPPH